MESEQHAVSNEAGLVQPSGAAALTPLGVDKRALNIILFYLAAVVAAECVTALVDAPIGLALYGILLVSLMIHAAVLRDDPLAKLLLTLIFPPMIRLTSLALPLVSFDLIYWYLLTSVPLFLAALVLARIITLPRPKVTHDRHWWLWQGGIALVGFVLGYLEYIILRPEPLIDDITGAKVWLYALILLISTGLLEEVIFRGLMQPAAVLNMDDRYGILYVAAIFAILHVGYRSLLDVVFVFVVGVLFGWVVYKTQSILGVTVSHGITNILLLLILPFILS